MMKASKARIFGNKSTLPTTSSIVNSLEFEEDEVRTINNHANNYNRK